MPFRFALLLLSILLLSSAGLPEKGPIPETKPVTVETPQPAAKTGDTTGSGHKTRQEPPLAKKDEKQAPALDDAKPAAEQPDTPLQPDLTIKAGDPKEYGACLTALKELGATFREEKRIDDGKGCGIDKPLTLQTVLPGITLKPEGKMRCETALELARWTKDAVLPAAKVALENEGPLITINQASSYICRLRNNATTGKISEHARGNAIDIASFTFKNGKSIEIQPRDDDSTLAGAFQRAVTATGCLYFETVLDPGSDEAHENHLHFDVIERKGGYRYCR
ncbi:extensin [Pararhizobium polonicum]|uniref:Extensin n=1 Tax=Pararhizobium polonicum TaxID=1612624 RepID=A0A1C7P0K4_9HYPH|nr:extensin family protein [Pararhizobium polonicum]OBZ93224.1 extensin [Pararhizobium polonicum]